MHNPKQLHAKAQRQRTATLLGPLQVAALHLLNTPPRCTARLRVTVTGSRATGARPTASRPAQREAACPARRSACSVGAVSDSHSAPPARRCWMAPRTAAACRPLPPSPGTDPPALFSPCRCTV